MNFGIPKAVEAIGNAVKSVFDFASTAKEEQCQTQIVKDKKRLKQATNIAQEIFRITDEQKHTFPEDKLEDYNRLRKKFDEKD